MQWQVNRYKIPASGAWQLDLPDGALAIDVIAVLSVPYLITFEPVTTVQITRTFLSVVYGEPITAAVEYVGSGAGLFVFEAV